MAERVTYCEQVFGFDLFMHFDINTGRSALMFKVVSSTDGWIKLPINEPSSANSQIQGFLDQYRGAGVQHIALLTPDINHRHGCRDAPAGPGVPRGARQLL